MSGFLGEVAASFKILLRTRKRLVGTRGVKEHAHREEDAQTWCSACVSHNGLGFFDKTWNPRNPGFNLFDG